MASNWEKGVIVGATSDGNSMFVASCNDTVVIFEKVSEVFTIGSCVEFKARRFNGLSRDHKSSCRRIVTDLKKCEPFCKFELEANSFNCSLILDIVKVEEKVEKRTGRTIRVFRTNFLKAVYDDGCKLLSANYNIKALLKMKVVCKRVIKDGVPKWVVKNVEKNATVKKDNRAQNKSTETKKYSTLYTLSVEDNRFTPLQSGQSCWGTMLSDSSSHEENQRIHDSGVEYAECSKSTTDENQEVPKVLEQKISNSQEALSNNPETQELKTIKSESAESMTSSDDSEDSDHEFATQLANATIESLKEELAKYKSAACLVRDLFADKKVKQAMKESDLKATIALHKFFLKM